MDLSAIASVSSSQNGGGYSLDPVRINKVMAENGYTDYIDLGTDIYSKYDIEPVENEEEEEEETEVVEECKGL